MELEIPEIDQENVIPELGSLPPGAILYEPAIARLFDRSPRSVKRAVKRGELPAPTRLFGKNAWTAGAILRHLDNRIRTADAEAAQERKDLSEKMTNLRPGHTA